MNRLLAATIMGIVVFATPLAASAQEFRDSTRHSDGDRGPRGGDDRRHERHRNDDNLAIGGIVGLTTGLLIGNGVAGGPRYERDFPPPPPPRARFDDHDRFGRSGPRFDDRRDFHRARFTPWSTGWYRWCSLNNRTFNPRTGMVIDRDGHRHFCTAG